jgi:beta-N-acetylhexosaminidase
MRSGSTWRIGERRLAAMADVKKPGSWTRRTFGALALAGAARLGAPALAFPRASPGELEADVGATLMVGFYGSTAGSPTARALARAIAEGRAGGVVFVRENVGSREEVENLTRLFLMASPTPPLIAIDHEGGAVQRLARGQGFAILPSARQVARGGSADDARRLYARAARQLADAGFNLNLAPVVDVQDRDNPAIGHFDRAFDSDPERVAAYAGAFVDGFASANVVCALKHFPGYGRARIDSHFALPDVTRGWSQSALTPYARLIAAGKAQVVMGGHMRLSTLDADGAPSTLSASVMTDLLRTRLGFKGVALTDDIDMAGLARDVPRREAYVRAVAAGADTVMIRNATPPDPHLTANAVAWMREAIGRGDIRREALAASAARVRALRSSLRGAVAPLVASP